MTRHFFFITTLLLFLTVPNLTWAGNNRRNLHIDLSYPGMAASYNLYKNGRLVCSSPTQHKDQMNCSVAIDPAPMTFVLTAVDHDGIESPQSAPYVLQPPKTPAAKFSTRALDAPWATVSFDASESDDIDGMIIDYLWDFGDGTTGTGKFIDHTYSAPGTYLTRLTVIDDDTFLAKKWYRVTIPPPPPPVAISQTLTAEFGQIIRGTLTDRSVPSAQVTFAISSPPKYGTIKQFNSRTGAFVYSPHTNFTGTDRFSFTANDGASSSSPATVTLKITPPNSAPTAFTDTVVVKAQGSVIIPVLANDSDKDGDALSVVWVSNPWTGTAQIINGALRYTASSVPGFLVAFCYQISDGKGGTATGIVMVQVTK